MSKVEIVVASMNQKDFSLYNKMNAHSDLLIANQSNHFEYQEAQINGFSARMITTATRGVGLNRNIGLMNSKSDILLLADDDIVYHENYDCIIERAFDEIPDADVIIFQMQFIKDGKVFDVDTHKTKKLSIWNGLSYGTYQIAIKRSAVERANLHFTQLFGGGCKYSAGEDSLFLIDCFRSGLGVYSYDKMIGDNIRDSSTWFSGFTNKFFYDRGAFAACAFPKMRNLICLYYLYAYRNKGTISTREKWNLMRSGLRNYDNLLSYEDWEHNE